jgi:hypothetical protein
MFNLLLGLALGVAAQRYGLVDKAVALVKAHIPYLNK